MKSVTVTIRHDLALDDCPEGLARKIRASLTIPNPKHQDAVKFGRSAWGIQPSIELFSMDTTGRLRLPRGFGLSLARLANEEETELVFNDKRRVCDAVTYDFKGTLRPYQQEAVSAVTRRMQGVLQAGTGAGKTVMALAIIAERKQPALILVHTKELLGQWAERIEQFLGIKAGTVGGGKIDIQNITVATVQTAKKQRETLLPRFGFLIVDECHRTPSNTFTKVASAFEGKYLLGLSATPYRRDGLTRLIYLTLGDQVHTVDPNHLRSCGAILAPEIVEIETDFYFYGDAARDYQKALTALTQDEERNELITRKVHHVVCDGPGTILLVSDRVAHLKAILGQLEALGHGARLLTGKTKAAEREKIVKDLAAGKVQILASTTALIGEGFDCPGLSTLFLCTPIKSRGRLIQVIGRVLRPKDGKKPRIFDFQDTRVGVLQAGVKARQRVYRELEAA